jgi:hypothetical protein
MEIKLFISKQDKSFIEDKDLDLYVGIVPKKIKIKAFNFLVTDEVDSILKSFDLYSLI